MDRSWMRLGAVGMIAVALAGCGTEKAAPPQPVAVPAVAEKPGQVVEQSVATVAAKVLEVDHTSRVVTLRIVGGETVDVHVGDEVKNFRQVQKGDDVVVTYYESVAIMLQKSGNAAPGVETADTVGRAKPGEKPSMAAGKQTKVTATVVGLNKKKGTITLKGPRGRVVTVTTYEPKRLDPVKVGDLLEVVYTEALAIAVEKPAKKK